jgi:site-specific recombinase XerD
MEAILMALKVLPTPTPSPLSRLVEDYLMSCRARGLSPRTDAQYGYALRNVFLKWCDAEGITRLEELDRRTFDRYTSYLLQKRTRSGAPITAHAGHSFLRPVRILLNWAARQGETVVAKPQLPRREKPIRDVLSRDEIDQLERVMPNERDKLIIRIFGDCGLRLDELTKLKADDIVRSGRQAHLRVLGKRNRMRDVPIPPTLLRRLDRYIEARPEERSADALFLTLRARGGVHDPLTMIGVYSGMAPNSATPPTASRDRRARASTDMTWSAINGRTVARHTKDSPYAQGHLRRLVGRPLLPAPTRYGAFPARASGRALGASLTYAHMSMYSLDHGQSLHHQRRLQRRSGAAAPADPRCAGVGGAFGGRASRGAARCPARRLQAPEGAPRRGAGERP